MTGLSGMSGAGTMLLSVTPMRDRGCAGQLDDGPSILGADCVRHRALRRSPSGRARRTRRRHTLRLLRRPNDAHVHAKRAALAQDELHAPRGSGHEGLPRPVHRHGPVRRGHGRAVDHGGHDGAIPRREPLGNDGRELARNERKLRDGLPVHDGLTRRRGQALSRPRSLRDHASPPAEVAECRGAAGAPPPRPWRRWSRGASRPDASLREPRRPGAPAQRLGPMGGRAASKEARQGGGRRLSSRVEKMAPKRFTRIDRLSLDPILGS